MYARERYARLSSDRSQFLEQGVDCSELTLPYLVQRDTSSRKGVVKNLQQPWQSVCAKAVVTLAAK